MDPATFKSVGGEVGLLAEADGEGVDAGGFVEPVQELVSSAAMTIALAVAI
jgi:hypothetical protein